MSAEGDVNQPLNDDALVRDVAVTMVAIWVVLTSLAQVFGPFGWGVPGLIGALLVMVPVLLRRGRRLRAAGYDDVPGVLRVYRSAGLTVVGVSLLLSVVDAVVWMAVPSSAVTVFAGIALLMFGLLQSEAGGRSLCVSVAGVVNLLRRLWVLWFLTGVLSTVAELLLGSPSQQFASLLMLATWLAAPFVLMRVLRRRGLMARWEQQAFSLPQLPDLVHVALLCLALWAIQTGVRWRLHLLDDEFFAHASMIGGVLVPVGGGIGVALCSWRIARRFAPEEAT